MVSTNNWAVKEAFTELHHRRTQRENGYLWTRKQALVRHWTCWCFDSRCLSLQGEINVCCSGRQSMVFYYNKPEQSDIPYLFNLQEKKLKLKRLMLYPQSSNASLYQSFRLYGRFFGSCSPALASLSAHLLLPGAEHKKWVWDTGIISERQAQVQSFSLGFAPPTDLFFWVGWGRFLNPIRKFLSLLMSVQLNLRFKDSTKYGVTASLKMVACCGILDFFPPLCLISHLLFKWKFLG